MLLFVVLWTLVELTAATALNRYTAYQVVWMRYGVHLLLMLAWWGWREPLSLVRTKRLPTQLARSFLMFVMPVSWFLAVQAGLRESTTMLVFWLSPLAVLALAACLLGERAPRGAWLLAALGALGGVAFFAPTPLPQSRWVLAAPLAMGLSFAVYVVMTRTLRDEPVRVNLFYTAFGVFLLLSPIVPFVWVAPSAGDFAKLAAVGVLGYFTLLALDRLAAAAEVSVSAPLIYLQLAITIALSIALGHVPADARHVGALALACAPLLLLGSTRRAAPTPALARSTEAAR